MKRKLNKADGKGNAQIKRSYSGGNATYKKSGQTHGSRYGQNPRTGKKRK